MATGWSGCPILTSWGSQYTAILASKMTRTAGLVSLLKWTPFKWGYLSVISCWGGQSRSVPSFFDTRAFEILNSKDSSKLVTEKEVISLVAVLFASKVRKVRGSC